ncbi:hypothetical protein [Pontimicrobium sp. SW4]|uniref:Uncharacterized protein n=1 Tax=Pontimicrobium sp. SW4 TaxID=3153519 RepID=A0AAU7BVH2_9FLAO
MKNNLNNIKNAGFKAPKDYFQNLEDQIMDNIKLDVALQNTDDGTGYKMPEGYLDTLEDVIFSKVTKTTNSRVISLFNKQTLIYISGVAAAVLIMLNVFWNSSEISIDSIDNELVENYIINEGINTYEIASLLTGNDDINLDIEIFDDTFNDDSLKDYLLENVNLEDIIDQ